MKRREFITLVGGAVAALPVAAPAQQPAMPVIGYLHSGYAHPQQGWAAFLAGLKEFGFIEGQNVKIEYRIAEGQYDRLPSFAADLVARQVDVIFADGSIVSPLAARAATTTIPIVFIIGVDPVRAGLVASLNAPGGNLTGVTAFGGDLVKKQIEVLYELMPNAKTFAALVNPKNPTHGVDNASWKHIADDVGVSIITASASSESDFEPAIASLVDKQVDAVFVAGDSLFSGYQRSLNSVLANHAMPAMFNGRQNVLDGGLISYGISWREAIRYAGNYVGRILKGEKPGGLPVLRPTKFELVINIKTARALGLTVPDSLLIRATEVIE